jgi:uncharacterized protein YndB with AHSA1/START domain
MGVIEKEIRINVPISRVWEAVSDIGGVHKYFPGSYGSTCLTGDKKGIGASRTCDLVPNPDDPNAQTQIKEVVVEWVEGKKIAMKAEKNSRGNWPYKKVVSSWTLSEVSGTTNAKYSVDFELNDQLSGDEEKVQINIACASILEGLKQFVETEKALSVVESMKILEEARDSFG